MKSNTLINVALVSVVGFGMTLPAQAQNAKVGNVQIEVCQSNYDQS
jgi:hypothetical protein